jgi:hypothetical protein
MSSEEIDGREDSLSHPSGSFRTIAGDVFA